MNSRRRIVHVFPSHSWGGAEIYMLELAEAQSRAGVHKKVDSPETSGEILLWVPAGSRLETEARKRGLALITDNCPERFSLPALWKIPAVLRRERITHVVAHWSGAVWAFLGLRFSRAPIVFILHIHMWISRVKKDLLHRFLYARLNRVIVAGERARVAALACLPVPAKKIVVIPYAIHLPEGRSADPAMKNLRTDDRAKRNWRPKDVVFGMFARIDKQKGQLEFLRAAQTVMGDESIPSATRESMRLIIVGDATAGEAGPLEYQKQIASLIAEDLALSAKTTQLSFRPDFAEILALCDVLVAPSYHESYALILLHAFALGVPVLSTGSGGTPDLITPAAGWLVPPQQIPELAAAIKEILLSPEIRRAKSNAARARVADQHSFASILAEYEKVLDPSSL